jgi:nucleoside-diphosphate-sugar epimerase
MAAKSVFVTGGSGYVGQYIAKELVSLGYRVALYDLRLPEELVPGATYTQVQMLGIGKGFVTNIG